MNKFTISPANMENVVEIFNLINCFSQEKIVLERNKKNIIKNIQNFIVAFREQTLIGCSSFHIYSPHLVEIRSLCVTTKYQNFGIGKKLVLNQIKIAKQLKFTKLFTLTLVENFFKKLGFLPILKTELPEKIFKDCNFCLKKNDCREKALIYHIN